jgi:outer membrane protein assembly factor BamA
VTVIAGLWSVLLATSARGAVDPNRVAVADSIVVHNTSIKFFPYAYYTPETEFAVGVGGIATFYTADDENLRPSKVVLSGYYTTTDQYLITINPELYFSRNQYFAGMKINFGHYVDKFYGIGNDTPDLGTERYVADRNGIELEVEMPPIFFISDRSGLVYDFEYSQIVDVQENPYLQDRTVTGSEGGTVSGLGGGWIWDRRDHTFYPTHGDFHEFTFVLYTSALGSDFTYWTLEHDNRRYISLGEKKVLAIQAYLDLAVGDAPFDRLPALGGQHRMRGYFEGRYRDKAYLMGQVEYRHVLSGRWGYVVFGAIGDVAGDLTLFKGSDFKFAGGAGIRFLFNKEENVNIRVDFGVGRNTSGVYFGVEEAF